MSVIEPSKTLSEDDLHHKPYRAVPLSTKNIAVVIVFLSIFSTIYLLYAQHHKVLFYLMTSVILMWIAFIYCAGILAVLYMVRYDYVLEENRNCKEIKCEEESTI